MSGNKLSAVKIPSDSSAASTGSFTSPEETFNWEKAWYPVLSEPFSDPEKAHAVQVGLRGIEGIDQNPAVSEVCACSVSSPPCYPES